ncbi:MAG: acyltransferase [Acidimicrobiia bacterium]|nr:acyltransferase [Acidimicrobiia bacterium]
MPTIRDIADRTPETRNRAIDFYRGAALITVVLGHWLASAVFVDASGTLRFTNILELTEWTHWLTWGIQVIPVFFIVGGYANWRSFHASQRRGDSTGTWITARFRRLMTPIVPFLAVWTAISVIAGLLGVDHALIRAGSFAVVTPLWFLAVYLLVILAVPVTVPLWNRFGWWTVVFGVALAFSIDTLRFATGHDWIGWLNFGAVWITAHQLGYGWATEHTRPRSAFLIAALPLTLAALVALTLFGPYPVSMVGVPGATENNTLPPTGVLVLLSLLQYGIVRLAEPAAQRLMTRRRPWRAVVGFHAVMMTVYVWHLPTMAIIVLIGYGVGFGFTVEPLTIAWWLTRPIWIAVLTTALVGVIAIFGRFEPRVRTTSSPNVAIIAFGVIASLTAISVGVVLGFVPEEGLMRWWVVALFATGVIALGAYPARSLPDTREGPSADGPSTR